MPRNTKLSNPTSILLTEVIQALVLITVSESWLSKVKAESRPHLNLKKMTIISWPLLTKAWNKESLEKLAWLEDILDLGKIQCVR